jgi:hypothetical protein
MMIDKQSTIDDADENIMAILKKVAEEESRIKSKALPRGHDYRDYKRWHDNHRMAISEYVKNKPKIRGGFQ